MRVKKIDVDLDELKDVIKKEWHDWEKNFKYPKKLFAENQIMKIKEMINKSFGGLIDEKNAALKFQLEVLAEKRYSFFIFGIITFILSVGIKLFFR